MADGGRGVFAEVTAAKRAATLDPGYGEAIDTLVKWLDALGLREDAAEWRLKLPGG